MIQLSQPLWSWPIDTKPGLTATFAEYRGDHFHTGLDFSTSGQEGVVIRTAAEGHIFKVRSQNQGYGKSIYIKHDDGWITVYAHLAAFGALITADIEAAGYDANTAFGTLKLNRPITRDSILAYSGESGAGLPHFHFETRDKNNRPVDPFTLGFPTIDVSESIKLEAVMVAPMSQEARVNGGSEPAFASSFPATLQSSGKVAIYVVASIKDNQGNTLGPREIHITDNELALASWKPNRISFDHYRDAGLVFDQCHSGFGRTKYVYAFDERRAPLSARHSTMPLHITETTKLKITIVGIKESRSYELTLDPDAPSVISRSPFEPPSVQPTTIALTAWANKINITTHVDGTLEGPLGLIGMAARTRHTFDVTPEHAANEWVWRTAQGVVRRWVGALPDNDKFQYALASFTLDYQGKNALPAQAVWLEPADVRVQSGSLKYVSPVLRFGREGYPTHGLKLSYPSNKLGQLGIYAWSSTRGRWVHWTSSAKEDVIQCEMDYGVPMVVAQDISVPVIGVPKTHRYFTGNKRVLPIRDLGSGVNWSSVSCSKEGKTIEFEVDRDRGWLVFEPSTAFPVQVRVRDRSGNHTERLVTR